MFTSTKVWTRAALLKNQKIIFQSFSSGPRRMTTPSETTSTCWSELYGKMLGPTMKNQNKLVREIPATLISSNRTRKLGCTAHSLLYK